MRIEPGLTGYMTERGMRWHVIRPDGTHEMQDASGRPFVRVKAWRNPNEDGSDRVESHEGPFGRYLCMICKTGPVHAPDCRLLAFG